MVYYVIKFVSEEYTLQYDTTCNRKIISDGELVVKAHYIRCMQENINYYWYHKNQQQVIILTTRTSVHICIDVVTEKRVNDIPRSIFNRNQAKKDLQRHPFCLTDPENDYILEEI